MRIYLAFWHQTCRVNLALAQVVAEVALPGPPGLAMQFVRQISLDTAQLAAILISLNRHIIFLLLYPHKCQRFLAADDSLSLDRTAALVVVVELASKPDDYKDCTGKVDSGPGLVG